MIDQLEMIARHDNERAQQDGPPRLVGMVMIAWAALILFGAMATLLYGRGGLYYLYCALGCGAVGWLLMQCSRWALWVHGALLLIAAAWAWSSAKGNSMEAMTQVAFLLIPALWMVAPPVRQPLE